MSQDVLKQGIAAVKDGRKIEGRRLLEQVVKTSPHSEQGWLWLSAAVDTAEERRYCLSQVLSINPTSPPAQRGLSALGPGTMYSPFEVLPNYISESDTQATPTISQNKQKNPSQALLLSDDEMSSSSTITCPRCNTSNPMNFSYCDACGTKLSPQKTTKPQTNFAITPLPEEESVKIQAVSKTTPAVNPIEPKPKYTDRQESGKGKGFSMVAAMIVLICFFLPWITVSCSSYGILGQDYNETWSGYDLASDGVRLDSGVREDSGVSTNDTQWLYITPGVAVLVVVILLFGGRKRVKGGTAAIITILALVGGGVLAIVYNIVLDEFTEFVGSVNELNMHAGYNLEFGFWGTIMGLGGMVLGVIADAVTKD